jgi:nitroreductase
MDLIEAMRHLPACREYEDRDVPDDVLYRVLDNARFAPSGGNRQGWRVVVVRDLAVRRALRDIYQRPWQRYVEERYGPADQLSEERRRQVADTDRMAATIDQIPVHLAVWVDMAAIAVTDAAAGRPSVVAGGSIFPFVHNVQLAARAEGLGTRITTMLSSEEPAVRELLQAPPGLALAAVLLVGWPVRLPMNLRRRPVEKFATVDRFDGPPLRPDAPT